MIAQHGVGRSRPVQSDTAGVGRAGQGAGGRDRVHAQRGIADALHNLAGAAFMSNQYARAGELFLLSSPLKMSQARRAAAITAPITTARRVQPL